MRLARLLVLPPLIHATTPAFAALLIAEAAFSIGDAIAAEALRSRIVVVCMLGAQPSTRSVIRVLALMVHLPITWPLELPSSLLLLVGPLS